MCRKLIYLFSFMLILSIASYVQADIITVGSVADTYVGGVGVHGADAGMYLQNTANYVGYVRFDLSGLDIITVRSATLTFTISGDTPRNDNPVTGRFVLNGLDNVAGNTPQDWDEAVLDVNTVGAEWSTNGGEPLVNVTAMDMNEADPVPAITETIAGSGDYWLPGARTITVAGAPIASFIQGRLDDSGLVTFILEFPGGGSGRGYGLATKENTTEAFRPKLEINAITETTPKIIFVTSVKDNDADGIQDDVSWSDWLIAEGYDVDFRPGNWIDPLDANDIAELEAADLVIASRGMATGEYDGAETDKWNALTTPVLCTNAWMIRSNRWVWMNSTAANKDAGSPLMLVLDATHPIFAGVPVDSDGLVEVLDPNVASGNTSFLNDILDAGNGTLLAQSLGLYNTAWIVEWDAGVEYYAGAGQITGGKRILFMAGTQDDPYTVESGLIQPVGVFNLNDAGQQLLRNILAYMLPTKPAGLAPVHSYTFEDGTTNDSVGDADGVLVGGAQVIDGAMVTTAQEQWMEMPGDIIAINSYEAATIECWYTPQAGANTGWSMLAYLGGNDGGVGTNGWFITTARADDKSRAAISTGSTTPWADETGADGPEYDDGLLHHMVSTLDADQITLYIDGVLIAATPMDEHNSISALDNAKVLLAKGGYDGDPEWIGAIEEFNIYNVALSEAEIAVRYAAGPQKVEPVGPSTEGLVAYYALDGNADDSSGNGLDGTLVTIGDANDATFVAGVAGMAIDLLPSENGTVGPCVNCGADPLFDLVDAVTVGAWVNFRSVPDEWRAIVAKGDSAWRIGNVGATTALHFGFCGYGSRPTTHGIDGVTEVGLDSWHYVCGTYDITEGAKLYVDGVLDVEIADTAGIALNTFDVTIGANMEDTGWKPYRLFDGMIDEVRIYNRALSADEVLALAGQ
jgi:hypothetical protein